MLWNFTKTGKYTVSSGYKQAKALETRAKGDKGTRARTVEGDEKLWKGIWNLNINKKIQHFIWRACHNKIPVGVNLRKKGMEIDEVCKQCGKELETVEHLFFHCPKARLR